jgi:hypothetical protein
VTENETLRKRLGAPVYGTPAPSYDVGSVCSHSDHLNCDGGL